MSDNERDTRAQQVLSKSVRAFVRLLGDDIAGLLPGLRRIEKDARELGAKDGDEVLKKLRAYINGMEWLLAGAPDPPQIPSGARDGMAAFAFGLQGSQGRLLSPPFLPGHCQSFGNVSAEESRAPQWARSLARNWRVHDRRQKAKLHELAERFSHDPDFRERWGSGYQAAKAWFVYLGLCDAAASVGERWSGRVGGGTGSGKPRDDAGKVAEIVPAELGDFGQAVWLGQEALSRAARALDSYAEPADARPAEEIDWPQDDEGRPLDLPEPEGERATGRRGPGLHDVLEAATPRQREVLEAMARHVYGTDDADEIRQRAAADLDMSRVALRNILKRMRVRLEEK